MSLDGTDEVTHQCKLAELAHAITNTASLEQILYSSDFFNNFISVSKTHYMCLDYITETNQLYADLYSTIQDTTRLLIHLYGDKVTLYRSQAWIDDPVFYHHFAFFSNIINPYKAYIITNKAMEQMGYKMDYSKSSFMLQRYSATDTTASEVYNHYNFGYRIRMIGGKNEMVDPIIISIRHDTGVVEKTINFSAIEGMSIDKYAEELGKVLTARGYNVRKVHSDTLHIFILIDGPADELDNGIFRYLDRIR